MSSGFGSTLASGIQDVSALLPLLGTEQCEQHVGSGLSRGYLYPAATPMSIFGSLGLNLAGVKTFVACTGGAHWLADAGFTAPGQDLSLIMVDESLSHEHRSSSTGEIKLITLAKRKMGKISEEYLGFQGLNWAWNINMVWASVGGSLMGLLPYIHLVVLQNGLPLWLRIVYPILRCLGSFVTAVAIQFLLQIQILGILELAMHGPGSDRKFGALCTLSTTGLFIIYFSSSTLENLKLMALVALPLGIIASLIGYVGSFSIVQSSESAWAPYLWLSIEFLLSLLRVYVWSWNPKSDDHYITIFSNLDASPPLFICDQYAEDIEEEKFLASMDADGFLHFISLYAGPVQLFHRPGYNLHYSLSRTRRSFSRVLYIAIEDPIRPIVRIIFRKDNQWEAYTATTRRLDGTQMFEGFLGWNPNIYQERLERRLRSQFDIDRDEICSDSDFIDALKRHYQSIVERLRWRDSLTQPAVNGRILVEYKSTWTLDIMIKSLKVVDRNFVGGNALKEHSVGNQSCENQTYFENGVHEAKQNRVVEDCAARASLYLEFMSQRRTLGTLDTVLSSLEEEYLELLKIAHIFWVEHEVLKAAIFIHRQTSRVQWGGQRNAEYVKPTPASTYRMLVSQSDALDRMLERGATTLGQIYMRHTSDIYEECDKSWDVLFEDFVSSWDDAVLQWHRSGDLGFSEWPNRPTNLSKIFGRLLEITSSMPAGSRARCRTWLDIFIKGCIAQFNLGGPLPPERHLRDFVEDTDDNFKISNLEVLQFQEYSVLFSQRGLHCLLENTLVRYIAFGPFASAEDLEDVTQILKKISCRRDRCITIVFNSPVTKIPLIQNSDITSVVVEGQGSDYGYSDQLDQNRKKKLATISEGNPGPFIFLDREEGRPGVRYFTIAFYPPEYEELLKLVISWRLQPVSGLTSPDEDSLIVNEADKSSEFQRQLEESRGGLILPIFRSNGLEREESDGIIRFHPGQVQTLTVRIDSVHVTMIYVQLLTEYLTPLTEPTFEELGFESESDVQSAIQPTKEDAAENGKNFILSRKPGTYRNLGAVIVEFDHPDRSELE
ncbi:hypothetical protein CVT26_015791 [Gymnopilus dilepis]|uniref:Uncharacterized protein n=1 Tax=Gymnopilus dilepis TaxID=231916 RepID=A0A409W4E0_9AGAR|nr:hypothetical protein CVT26_015791 [Gymnopilus dilepis]